MWSTSSPGAQGNALNACLFQSPTCAQPRRDSSAKVCSMLTLGLSRRGLLTNADKVPQLYRAEPCSESQSSSGATDSCQADRQRVVARDLGVVGIRHCRKKMRAVAAGALCQRIDELLVGPGTDAGMSLPPGVSRSGGMRRIRKRLYGFRFLRREIMPVTRNDSNWGDRRSRASMVDRRG